MADTVSKEVRSRMMSGIRATNTKPEMILRRGLHGRGLRFRLHGKDLPGKPDLVFPKYRAVLFAHGCFWHGHECPMFKWPSSRVDYWHTKITRNVAHDAEVAGALAGLGWRRGVVWECALKGKTRLPHGDVLDACAAWIKGTGAAMEIAGR